MAESRRQGCEDGFGGASWQGKDVPGFTSTSGERGCYGRRHKASVCREVTATAPPLLPLLGQHELCHIGYFRAGAVQELQLVVA